LLCAAGGSSGKRRHRTGEALQSSVGANPWTFDFNVGSRNEHVKAGSRSAKLLYHYCDTEPQPRDGRPRGGCALDLGGEGDGPKCGSPPGQMRASCAVGRLASRRSPRREAGRTGKETATPTGTAREWTRQIHTDTREAAA